MNSHCLYCGKRLSFFHSRKKPYCSEVHEDRYLEREAQAGLDRLQYEYPGAAHQSPGEMHAAQSLPPPKDPELFSYGEVDPSILDDANPAGELFHSDEQGSDDRVPPAAPYLIAGTNAVRAASPALLFREPGEASFPAEHLIGATALEGSGARLSLSASHIGPGLVIFPCPHAEPVVGETLQTQPEPLAQITCLARLQTRPLPISETTPARVSSEPLLSKVLSIAVPEWAPQARLRTLAPVSRRAPLAPSQTGAGECLPAPQPLRFRTLLDLHNPMFQTGKRRIAPIAGVALDWNAAPPETVPWRSNPIQRHVTAVIPKLSVGVTRRSDIPNLNIPDLNPQAHAPMAGVDK